MSLTLFTMSVLLLSLGTLQRHISFIWKNYVLHWNTFTRYPCEIHRYWCRLQQTEIFRSTLDLKFSSAPTRPVWTLLEFHLVLYFSAFLKMLFGEMNHQIEAESCCYHTVTKMILEKGWINTKKTKEILSTQKIGFIVITLSKRGEVGGNDDGGSDSQFSQSGELFLLLLLLADRAIRFLPGMTPSIEKGSLNPKERSK